MPERWRSELEKLERIGPERAKLQARVSGGPRLPEPPASPVSRVAAAGVALAVAVAAIGFAVVALRGDGSRAAGPDPAEVCGFTSQGGPEVVKLDSLDREPTRAVLDEPGHPASELDAPGAGALQDYLATPAAVNAPSSGWRVLIEEPGSVTFGAPFDSEGRWFVVGFEERQGRWHPSTEMLANEVPTDAQMGAGLRLEWSGPVDLANANSQPTLSLVNDSSGVWSDARGEHWAVAHVFDRETGLQVEEGDTSIAGVGTRYSLEPGGRATLPVTLGGARNLAPGEYDVVACVPALALASPVGTLRVLPPGSGPAVPDVAVLRYRGGDGGGMAALGGGVLAVRDGCLAVEDAPYEPTFVIWPPGWRLQEEGDRLVLVDAIGEPVAHVGDRITFGGGFLHLGWASDLVLEPIPESCRVSGERYFLTTGEIVESEPGTPSEESG